MNNNVESVLNALAGVAKSLRLVLSDLAAVRDDETALANVGLLRFDRSVQTLVHDESELVPVLDWVHEATSRGIGIALLPEFACREDLQADRLRQVLAEWSSRERPLYALYPTAQHLSQKVIAFIDMLSAGLSATRRKT